MSSWLETLRAVPILAELPDADLENLAALCREVELDAGEGVFREGDPGDAMYFIAAGAVDVLKELGPGGGTTVPLAMLEAGDFFGEMSLFDDRPRSATVRTRVPTTLLTVGQADFDGLLEKDPRAATRLLGSMLAVIAGRLRRTNAELAVLFETGRLIGAEPQLKKLARKVLDLLLEALGAERGAFLVCFPAPGCPGQRAKSKEQSVQTPDTMRHAPCAVLDRPPAHQLTPLARRYGPQDVPPNSLRGETGSHYRRWRIVADRIGQEMVDMGEPLLVGDLTAWGQTRHLKVGSNRYLLGTPLLSRGTCLGVILLAAAERLSPFTVDDLNLLTGVAQQIAGAVERNLRAGRGTRGNRGLERLGVRGQ